MRSLAILAVTFVVLIGAGSIYLHLDTKQFVEKFPKHGPNDTERIKDSHQPNYGNPIVKQNSQSEEVSKPAWSDDTADNILDSRGVHIDDPWADFLSQEMEKADETREKDSEKLSLNELDPNDPYDLYEMMIASYIKEFGDVPEIYIVSEGWLKGKLGITKTPEEKLAFLEAMNYLNPQPSTQRSIEIQKLIVAGDYDTLIEKYGTPATPESQQPFIDVKPFFDGSRMEEGFRLLRAADPERSAEFEEFIRAEAYKSPHMKIEKIEQAIQDSYAPPQEK